MARTLVYRADGNLARDERPRANGMLQVLEVLRRRIADPISAAFPIRW